MKAKIVFGKGFGANFFFAAIMLDETVNLLLGELLNKKSLINKVVHVIQVSFSLNIFMFFDTLCEFF